jgi:hypothetical protein
LLVVAIRSDAQNGHRLAGGGAWPGSVTGVGNHAISAP